MRSLSSRCGTARALAAKSLITRRRLSSSFWRTASIENVHGWFVKATSSLVMEAARTANTACVDFTSGELVREVRVNRVGQRKDNHSFDRPGHASCFHPAAPRRMVRWSPPSVDQAASDALMERLIVARFS